MNILDTMLKSKLKWPLAFLVLLLIVNSIIRNDYLKVTVQGDKLFGEPINILRNSAPLMLVALGMTIVIATRGIDLSVGAIMSVSGAVALTYIDKHEETQTLGTVFVAIGLAILVAVVLGAWNGFLTSVVGIQPIVATLVLMLAGRGIALLITKGFITTVNSDPYKFMSQGYLLFLPFAFFVSVAAILVVSLVERRTALGVLTESVGINPEASRLAGVRSRGIIWGAYIASGALSGIAGILYSSNIMAADANAAGNLIELDAILAVVLGGTSLMGGKFSIGGTVIGVFTIQTLKSSITSIGVPPAASPLFLAGVVIVVVVVQSSLIQGLFKSWSSDSSRAAADAGAEKVEVAK